MREIKFRAWDGKRMHTPDISLDEDFYVSCEGEIKYLKAIDYAGDIAEYRPKEWVLMQFTGLKDKNGKEIYEGDIVTCGERLGVGRLLRHATGEVHYVQGSACFCIQIPWIEFGDKDDGSKVSWEMSHYSDIEIIGDIYSNPELV